MFLNLKKKVQGNWEKLSKQTNLFYVDVDRDKIWEEYLNGFNSEVKQEHNCNCCKSFLRQFGGIVAIIDNKMVSLWDNIEIEEEFRNSVKNLKNYIHSLPINNVFVNDFKKCGTDKNYDSKKDITWNHFFIEIKDNRFIAHKDNLDSIRGDRRSNKEVLKRSLKELTIDATETILELIGQNSLYRGTEFKGILEEFLKLQKEYKTVPKELKDNYTWLKSTQVSQSLAKIRNTAIGTLLIDLSEGMELDQAVTKFERVVAPTNYKRPSALITPKMVEQAKEKLNEMGLTDSLERRYANETDLKIDNIIFTDKSTSVKDVFKELSEETLVNPKTLTKVEEISIEDFINNVVPTSKSIEILPENSHLNNFVTILTAKDKDAPTLFKWENSFSWSYTGGITDSIKERVKAAGGNVEGVLRFSIQWNEDGKSICDLDAHAFEPNGTHIYYGSYKGKPTTMTGMLDVDMIRPANVGVENITWTDINKMKEGRYQFGVHNFDSGRHNGFTAQVEMNGEIHEFSYPKHFINTIQVAEVTYSKSKGFEIKSLIDSKLSINSKEKWGINTNKWKRVSKCMLSPNYWQEETGNKHYLFILEGCVCDEKPRPFFNEFLKPEFNENRKVFEVLGAKLRIPETNNQLSGIGFSETQRNRIFVRVDGKFKRTLKVNI